MLLCGSGVLLHFGEVAQPLLSALAPKLDLRLIPICPCIPLARKASNPHNNRSVLRPVSQSDPALGGRYQNVLHDDERTSAFPAKVVLDVVPAVSFLIVLGRRAFGVFESAGREDGAVREGAAFVLTIGAVADRMDDRLPLAFEFDGAAHAGTFVDHFEGIEYTTIESKRPFVFGGRVTNGALLFGGELITQSP